MRVSTSSHGRQVGQREQRPGQEHHRGDHQLHHRHGGLDLLDPCGQHQPHAVTRNAIRNSRTTQLQHQQRVVGHADEPGHEQDHHALQRGDRRPAQALADTMIELVETGATSISRRNPNSRSHTDRDAGERGGEQHRDRQHAREEERAEVHAPLPADMIDDSPVPSTNRNRTGCANDAIDPPAVREEPDQLALPDRHGGARTRAPSPARGHLHVPGRSGRCLVMVIGVTSVSPEAPWRARSGRRLSASRMVRPVWARNTSSRRRAGHGHRPDRHAEASRTAGARTRRRRPR